MLIAPIAPAAITAEAFSCEDRPPALFAADADQNFLRISELQARRNSRAHGLTAGRSFRLDLCASDSGFLDQLNRFRSRIGLVGSAVLKLLK